MYCPRLGIPRPSSSRNQLAPLAHGIGVAEYKSCNDGLVTIYVHTNPNDPIFLFFIMMSVRRNMFSISEIGSVPTLNPMKPNRLPSGSDPVWFDAPDPPRNSRVTGCDSKSAMNFVWMALNCFSINRRVWLINCLLPISCLLIAVLTDLFSGLTICFDWT